MFEITIWRSGSWCCSCCPLQQTNKQTNKTKQKHQIWEMILRLFVWWLQMSFWSPHSLGFLHSTLAHGVNNGDGTGCQQVSSLERGVCVCVCVCVLFLEHSTCFSKWGSLSSWKLKDWCWVVLFLKHGCMIVRAIRVICKVTLSSHYLWAWY